MAGDAVRVTVTVPAPPARAFALFTAQIDQWWQQGRRFRNGPPGASRMELESGIGGRLLEWVGSEPVVIGRITAWQPPTHIAMVWRNVNFAAAERTQLDITFTPLGAQTRVSVHHRGWSTLPDGHPARHGQPAEVFIRTIARWWGRVLVGYQEVARAG